ncbi:MAG: hypothetical protein ABW074_06400, partial [Sedimenticola sp.]
GSGIGFLAGWRGKSGEKFLKGEPNSRQLERAIEIQAANIRSELEILQRILESCSDLTAGMRFTIEYGIAANQALLALVEQRKAPLLEAISREQSRSTPKETHHD